MTTATADARTTRLAQVVFALLVLATFGAFFVSQRLKQQPRIVRTLTVTSLFSPNGDQRREVATIRFRLDKASDDVTVTIIDSAGDTVRELWHERPVAADQKQKVLWDGRTSSGRKAPSGFYRVRILLKKQARSAILLKPIHLDNSQPLPIVRIDGWEHRQGPLILPPGGGRAPFTYAGPFGHYAPLFTVYRSDVHPIHIVTRFRGTYHSKAGAWDGRIGGRPAPPGTYFVAARVRNLASTTGTSPPVRYLPPGSPASRPGVTIRALAAQAPDVPVRGGQRARFFVDARGASYQWRIRRVGAEHPFHAYRTVRGPVLSIRAPRGTGVYLLELRSGRGRHHARVPFAVQGASHHPVLVVLPVLSWQARNLVDDDGNGLPNTFISFGTPRSPGVDDTALLLQRPYAGPVAGFATHEQPLLAFLDRAGLRYDVTTDLALLRQTRTTLAGHRGVVLAGTPTWLPDRLRENLRAWVRDGGRLFVPGADVLQRGQRVTATQELAPSPPAPSDVFGARFGPVRRGPVAPLIATTDRIEMFAGTSGQFTGFQAAQRLLSAGPDATLVAQAGPAEGGTVIAGLRVGKGLVIRTGLPGWAAQLGQDPDVDAFTERAWALLER